MHHIILVKFKKNTENLKEITKQIEVLFNQVSQIEGVHSVTYRYNVTPRENRYDLMIDILMELESLPRFDESKVHLTWKEQYACYLEAKAIFDY